MDKHWKDCEHVPGDKNAVSSGMGRVAGLLMLPLSNTWDSHPKERGNFCKLISLSPVFISGHTLYSSDAPGDLNSGDAYRVDQQRLHVG